MSFRRYLGLVGLLAATTVFAQSPATAPAQVNVAPEVAPAEVATLADDTAAAGPGDATAGAGKAAVCAACHGMDGNAADPQYPKLAGQHERYIARQLALYKSGERANAIMLGFAAMLSPQDMRDIGAYFASQKVRAGVADESLVASGPNEGKKFYQVGEQLYRGGDLQRGVPAVAPVTARPAAAIQARPTRASAASMRPIPRLSCAPTATARCTAPATMPTR
jgi:cytochrome c553